MADCAPDLHLILLEIEDLSVQMDQLTQRATELLCREIHPSSEHACVLVSMRDDKPQSISLSAVCGAQTAGARK